MVPRRVDVDLGGRDVDDQRQRGEMLVNIDAPDAVDRADPGQHAVAGALRFDEQRRVVQVEADHVRVVRQARHERAVVLDDRRAAVLADRKAVEQRAEVVDAERADDDAGERAVGPVDPAAERDRQCAAAQPGRIRLADVEALREPVAMDGEVVAVAEIALPRGRCARIDNDVAVRVHHEDRPEKFAGGRAVEQQPVALARRQGHQFGVGNAVDDVLQRQIVELDIARDIAFDQQHQVACIFYRMVICIAPRLD